MIDVQEYIDATGKNYYAAWFADLDAKTAARIAIAVTRMAAGNFSDIKPVGRGVSERRLDFGPGYRIYFAKDGGSLILLLGGGSKQRQQKDIEAAQARWAEYKERRKEK